MSKYLLNNRNKYKASVYGAISITSVSLNSQNEIKNVVYHVHSNFTARNAGPIFSNIVATAVLKTYDSTQSIQVNLHPFPSTVKETSIYSARSESTIVTFIMLAIPCIPAGITPLMLLPFYHPSYAAFIVSPLLCCFHCINRLMLLSFYHPSYAAFIVSPLLCSH